MTGQWTRRRVLRVGGVLGTLGVAGCLNDPTSDRSSPDESLSVASARQFSGPGCQCCTEYATYLQGHLDADLKVSVPDDIGAIKRQHGVPRALQSCHTVVLDGYVVEGHVPVVAISQLLAQHPPIDGISLPGMPAGSPGMGGAKDGPFTIYVVDGQDSGSVYETV